MSADSTKPPTSRRSTAGAGSGEPLPLTLPSTVPEPRPLAGVVVRRLERRERPLLAQPGPAAVRRAPQDEVVDRRAVGDRGRGREPAETEPDRRDARDARLRPPATRPRRRSPASTRGRRSAIAGPAGAVTGAGQVDPEGRVTGRREVLGPGPPGAIRR